MKLQELCDQELCRIQVRRGAWGESAGSMSLPEAVATEAVGDTFEDWYTVQPNAPKWDLVLVALNAAGGAFLGVVVGLLTVWWLR